MKNGIGAFALGLAVLTAPSVLAADGLFQGLVLKVDPDRLELFVKNPKTGAVIRFTASETTVVGSPEGPKKLVDLRPGDPVEIRYDPEGSVFRAVEVNLISP